MRNGGTYGAVVELLCSAVAVIGVTSTGKLVIVVTLTMLACGRSKPNWGTIALCVPEDSSGGVLVIDADDFVSKSDVEVISRVLIPLDTATGKAESPIDAGERAECLGGLGASVVIVTAKHGLHVRDPRTGAVVVTQDQLVGPNASLGFRTWHYDAATHRIYVRASFNREVGANYVIDAITHARWPEGAAPALPIPRAELPSGQVRGPYVVRELTRFTSSGSYGIACEGNRCTLATRELDARSAGGNALTPIAGADVLLVAQGVSLVPALGALVTRLRTLDEATREFVLVGFDGKVRWTRSGIKKGPFRTWQLDDHILLAKIHDEDGARSNYAMRVDLELIDNQGHATWSYTFEARRNTWDMELTQAVARNGDVVLLAANGEVTAMPIGPGEPRWHFVP